ncbi:hypothetical protein A2U01_0099504, partial [Trifolium medium]|nr:hypothetical protein [Trifolium medium]
ALKAQLVEVEEESSIDG